MSAFARLCGTEEPKLPVWPTIAGMTRVMDGEITLPQFATEFELSQAETAEVGEYLTAIGGMVTTRATSLVSSGLSVSDATEVARAVVNAKVMHALLRAEQGSYDEAGFRAVFGL